jgi:predicted lipoprotein with Yx(FWY)xxD motif
MSSALLRTAAIAVATLLLSACGGGGNSSPSTPVLQATLPPATPVPVTPATLTTAQLNGALGFVTPAGRTVYIFDADLAAPGTSTCNGACATNWPPVAPPAGVALSAHFATLTRTDGSTQLTYSGRPLYTFIADSASGQANGDGLNAFGGLWHVSRPAGSSSGTSPNPPPVGSY